MMAFVKSYSTVNALVSARAVLALRSGGLACSSRALLQAKPIQIIADGCQSRQVQNVAWTAQPRRPFGGPTNSFRQTIFACQSVAELGRSATRLSPLTAENAICVLRRACDLTPAGPATPEVVRQIPPPVLDELLTSIHENIHVLSFDQLTTIVTFCLKFNLAADSRFWVSLERQLRFIIPKLDINQLLTLVKLLDSHVSPKASPSPPAVIVTLAGDLSNTLRSRLPEVTKPADLLFALYKFSPPSTPVSVASNPTRELNDRLVGCIARLTPKQLYRAFYVQTRLETRHTPLLRAIAYYLRQPGRLDSLSPVHLLNVLFACAELNVTESRLIKSVIVEAKKRYAEYSPTNLVALTRSVGSLQLHDTELIAKLINSGLQLKNNLLLADAVVAAGVTGLYPGNTEVSTTVGDILTKHLSEVSKSDPSLWLKLVWSLFALRQDKNCAELEEVVKPLFSEDFASKLVKPSLNNKPDSESQSQPGAAASRNPATRRVRLQVANIREIIRLEHPALHAKLSQKLSPLLAMPSGDCRIRAERPQFDLCLDTFAAFCDVKKYVTMDRPTDGGTCIDFVVYVDKNGELVPTESHVKDVAKADASQRPVAIKVCEFAEQTLVETQPNGLAQLHSRLYASLGYRPVVLTTVLLSRTMPIAQRAQNLQDMIKKAAST